MTTFYIKQGDLAPNLQYQLLGAGNVPQALTGTPAPDVTFKLFDKRPVWPLTGPTCTPVTNSPALPAGAYVIGYTYVLAIGGMESFVSGPSGVVNVSSGQAIQIIAPTLPSWASSIKWYILAGPPNTVGFVLSTTVAGAFIMSAVGNGTLPPFNVASEITLIQSDSTTGHVTIDDPPNGVVSYHWQTGDTASAGTYYASFTSQPSGGAPESFPNNDYILISIAPQ